jgi:hypothetical protein
VRSPKKERKVLREWNEWILCSPRASFSSILNYQLQPLLSHSLTETAGLVICLMMFFLRISDCPSIPPTQEGFALVGNEKNETVEEFFFSQCGKACSQFHKRQTRKQSAFQKKVVV